ncbi:hypothetical protein SBF1_780006 [Candidatus Desulfosporosinus infrequens]|uniref:Uncharacterized protein n=1 Tax=Candidatus Desulfosporosinus infrequens TaxID=2043169 RepID=A0A2U3LS37_9FIRM|nr:hypothetical protein SBF1_780006 [Candidatus Desulfosporosinus infrequens]
MKLNIGEGTVVICQIVWDGLANLCFLAYFIISEGYESKMSNISIENLYNYMDSIYL